MKRKLHQLGARVVMTLLLALFSSSAWSQEELTVYEGDATNNHVPAYIYYFDAFTRSQFVIPASDLADMVDGMITSVKFYTTGSNIPLTTSSDVVVYLKEVDYTSISSYEATDGCTTVYTGKLSIVAAENGGELTIEFNAPFSYRGGNLLIGIDNTTNEGYKQIYFYGQSVDGASISNFNTSSLDDVQPSQQSFIPKTTFTYLLTGIHIPKNITASNLHYDQVDIDWIDFNGEGATWEIAYCEDMGGFEPGSDGYVITNVTTHPFTLTGLNETTTYEVSVRALVGGEYSDWNRQYNIFTTPARFAVPEGLAAGNIATTTADISWTPVADAVGYNLRYQESQSANTATITLTADDVWNDGSGYQMLLDPTASTYGSTFPETGPLTSSGDADASVYALFEYKIPTDADGSLTTTHIVSNGASVTIEVPAGTYDWCITNPTPGDRMWISSAGGSVGGRADDYVFEAGKSYEFHVYYGGSNDAVDVTIGESHTFAIDPSAWIVINGADIPQELTGLTPDANYAVEVQGVFDSDNSEWSDPVFFHTEATYPKPLDLQADEVKADKVILSWTPGEEGQTVWDVAYMADGDADFTIISGVTEIPYILEGLTPEMAYTVKIRANYGVDEYSAWTTPIEFTTKPTNAIPTNLLAGNLTHDSATLTWEGVQDTYDLRWRTAAINGGLSESWEQGLGDWSLVNCHEESTVYEGEPYDGNHFFAFRYNTNPPQYLISPELAGISEGATLSFYYKAYSSNYPESFKVGYSTTTKNLEDFTWSDETTTSDTNWQKYELALPEGVQYISIMYTSYDMYYLFLDYFLIEGEDQPAGEWQTVEDVTSPYELSGLEIGTNYEWQVMGKSPDTEWSESAFFTTLDTNNKIFIADGDWDDENNWFPVGVPTANDDVTIKAAATIPTGVIAWAKTITMDGGSLTLKNLAELKTKTEGVPVTIERDINANQYYLLSNPVNKFMMFNDVENLTDGTYDVYQFLANQDYEWLNIKSHGMALVSGLGFLYANSTSRTVAFTGTTLASIDAYDYNTIDYNSSSTDFFNGWKLVGNPFPCTAYLYAINSSSVLQAAQFYKLNETGEAFEVYSQCVTMAPGESVFIQVTSPSLYYYVSSDDLGFESTYLGTVDYPTLPVKWNNVDQDAAPNFYLVDDADDNDTWFDYFNGYTGVNVGIDGRTLFTDGRWNTICLPFDLTLEGSPLEGATARTLKGASVVDKVLNLDWDDPVTELQAGVPYIIKWETPLAIDNIENPLFTFNSSPVNVNAAPTYDEVDGVVTFVGTYAPVTFDGENRSVLLMGTDCNLFYPDGLAPSWVNAFRGYFQLNANYTAGDKAITGVKMNFDGEATGIDTMQNEEFIMHNSEIYDLSGRRVSTPAKGMYIKDGKKILIK